EEEDDEDGALGDFIVDNEAELASAEQDALRHRSAARSAVFHDDETLDADAIEAQLRERYSGYGRASMKAPGPRTGGDGEWTPARLLIPGISDPHLWMARCVPGKERDVVFAAARRVFQWASSGKFNGVYSVFSRDGLSGYVYVEARNLADAQAALEGISGAFAFRMTLVPIDDMVDVVKIKAQQSRLNPGAWVRVKRGNYAGDLAQVVAVIEASEAVEVRLLPRIDYAHEGRAAKGARPAPRLFSVEEAQRADPRGLSSRQNEILWRGDRFVGGYLHKDMRVASLQTADVSPTLDEIARFAAGDAGEDGDEQAAIAALASQAAAASLDLSGVAASGNFQPGDVVEVVDGDLAGVVGTVRSVDGDGTVRVAPELGGLRRGAVMGFPVRQLRKRFRTGDHVQVQAGRLRGATGMVLAVADAVVTVYTDVDKAEIRVLSKDLRVSSDVASAALGAPGAQGRGGIQVHDLVQLDAGQVAVVLTAARDTVTVLDDRGEPRTLPLTAVRAARGGFERSGVDFNGAALRRGDHVREVGGQQRSGSVLQVTRFATFVLPRDAPADAVFAVRTRQLESLSARATAALEPYATRVDRTAPGVRGRGRGGAAVRGGRVGALRGRDPLVGKTVVATRGPYKGYVGIVKDAAATSARVELHTSARVVNIDKDKLAVRLPSGDTVPAVDFATNSGGGGGGRPPPAAAVTSSSGGGWGAPSARGSSGGYNAPSSGAGGWDVGGSSSAGGWDAAPASSNSGGGGWGAAPASSNSGGWATGGSAATPSSGSGGGGGWDMGTAAAATTPGASSNWGTPAAAPSNWATPAAGSSTAPSNWGTPAPLTPGALPQTPGGPYETPSYYDAPTPAAAPSTNDDSSNGNSGGGFFSWAVPRVLVELGSSGQQRATIRDISTDRASATLVLEHGGSQRVDRASVARMDVRPVRAEKRDRVVVIRGSRRGALGTMVGRDGSEAFFQPDGDSSWHSEPLRNLAVYSDKY
ncbi:transcription elongation factor spt5, partial [Kickxella alabastrina]